MSEGSSRLSGCNGGFVASFTGLSVRSVLFSLPIEVRRFLVVFGKKTNESSLPTIVTLQLVSCAEGGEGGGRRGGGAVTNHVTDSPR